MYSTPMLTILARDSYAERAICYRPFVRDCPSACLSVRHTGGSVWNGWS